MAGNRYEKYSDTLTQVQKRELKHKEYRPDGEKRHLQIISYNDEKLIEIISDDCSSLFDKSIAKEEILRRLVREKKRKENKKPKNNKAHKKKYKGKSKKEKWKRFEETAPKTGTHIGEEFKTQYDKFISGGGNIQDCPFDSSNES